MKCKEPCITNKKSDRFCLKCANEIVEPEDWLGKFVKCDLCSHQWTAVYFENCYKLECPNCNNMVYFKVIN